MRKIPTIFQRNPERMSEVLPVVNPECQWVLDGEGSATRKYDGTCCMVRDGKLYKRHELRPGKTAPEGFEPAQDKDPNTGKQPGWIPAGRRPEDKWHREAWDRQAPLPDGTYELVGPKVQGNPERRDEHFLVPHALAEPLAAPRDFDALREWLADFDGEGIVWHHPDGRMAKIKRKDFAQ